MINTITLLGIWTVCSMIITLCFMVYLLKMREQFEIGHIILMIIIFPISLVVFINWILLNIFDKFFEFCRKPIWIKEKDKQLSEDEQIVYMDKAYFKEKNKQR